MYGYESYTFKNVAVGCDSEEGGRRTVESCMLKEKYTSLLHNLKIVQSVWGCLYAES